LCLSLPKLCQGLPKLAEASPEDKMQI